MVCFSYLKDEIIKKPNREKLRNHHKFKSILSDFSSLELIFINEGLELQLLK